MAEDTRWYRGLSTEGRLGLGYIGKPGLASGPHYHIVTTFEAKEGGEPSKSWHLRAVGVVVGGEGISDLESLQGSVRSVHIVGIAASCKSLAAAGCIEFG